MTLKGPAVLDIVQHFTERWNEIKYRKVCSIVISGKLGVETCALNSTGLTRTC